MDEVITAIQPRRLKRLLRRLVDIYSPSGKEEEILQFLSGYCKRNGLAPVFQPVDENRFNLVLMPPGVDVRLAWIGHLDTVAAYDLEAYGYEEEGDIITGLGTADMKAGCAAMVEAFLTLRESSRWPAPIALCLVVGEEEEGDGVRHLVEEYHFPWALIGEPTDLAPCLSSYGYLEIQVCTRGKRVHASLAKRGKSPVEVMMHVIMRISQFMERERPGLVYNIRDLFSSPAGFAVPERCEAWLDIHLPPGSPAGEIITELEELGEKQRRGFPSVETSVRVATIDAGYELADKGAFVSSLKAAYSGCGLPWKPSAFISHSDANQLWRAGVKPVLLGPGSLEKAHAPDESVSFTQACLAAELYCELALKLNLP